MEVRTRARIPLSESLERWSNRRLPEIPTNEGDDEDRSSPSGGANYEEIV